MLADCEVRDERSRVSKWIDNLDRTLARVNAQDTPYTGRQSQDKATATSASGRRRKEGNDATSLRKATVRTQQAIETLS